MQKTPRTNFFCQMVGHQTLDGASQRAAPERGMSKIASPAVVSPGGEESGAPGRPG
ncbi:hypothetical protein EYF80_057182 [Liparis tanakae]|uniref:Uncharacterized protein n=1 Tax=Liparis tanakae TaxID=230148 RepID=A0A4Z2EUP5_9TELE|nr:hypothetical protein EYF80_057182 [Liparis tanakae]